MEKLYYIILDTTRKIVDHIVDIIFCGPLVNKPEPCDFSIEGQYKTVIKVKSVEPLKQKIQESKMCVGCKNFETRKHGVGRCAAFEQDVLERDYPLTKTCFQ